jgi:hypothetical protein
LYFRSVLLLDCVTGELLDLLNRVFSQFRMSGLV